VSVKIRFPKPPKIKAAFIVLAAISVGFFALTGCNTLVNEQVQDGIKSNLPKVIGPADSWDVNVSGNPGTILKGRIPGVIIHGVNVQASPTLTLQSIDIDAKNIRFNTRSHAVSSIDSIMFAGVMNQKQLDTYLSATAPSLPGHPKDLKIELRQNDLQISFKYGISKVNIPVKVDGRLAVSKSGDEKIDFIPSGASIAKASIPKKLLEYAVKKINPVVDLTSMPFPLHLTEIKIDNHQILLAGSASLSPAALEAAQKQLSNGK
jgi:hypothetical protein